MIRGLAIRRRPADEGHSYIAYAVGSLALVGAVVAGLLVGAADLPVRGVLLALVDELPFVDVDHGLSPVQHSVLMEIRMPRVLGAVVVGSLLAVAGAGYQGSSATRWPTRTCSARRPGRASVRRS